MGSWTGVEQFVVVMTYPDGSQYPVQYPSTALPEINPATSMEHANRHLFTIMILTPRVLGKSDRNACRDHFARRRKIIHTVARMRPKTFSSTNVGRKLPCPESANFDASFWR